MQILITENLIEGFVLYPDSKSSVGWPTPENENAGRLKGKAPQTEGRGSYKQDPNHEIRRIQWQIPNQIHCATDWMKSVFFFFEC